MKLEFLHQIVGKTRTDKIIICALNLEELTLISRYYSDHGYSADELLDALAVFEYLLMRAMRKEDPFLDLYAAHSRTMFELLVIGGYEDAKSRAGIITVFDLNQLGHSLVRFEFKAF